LPIDLKDEKDRPHEPAQLFLIHHEPRLEGISSARFADALLRLHEHGRELLPFTALLPSPTVRSEDFGLLVLNLLQLDRYAPFLALPVANVPWFAHGAVTAEQSGLISGQEDIDNGSDRRLAIRVIPADRQRFQNDFDRVLRAIAPYHCEVSEFVRVIKTPMAVRECGQRLLTERALAQQDRFLVLELTHQTWFASNAKREPDCEFF